MCLNLYLVQSQSHTREKREQIYLKVKISTIHQTEQI
jgi:hypothetical protein